MSDLREVIIHKEEHHTKKQLINFLIKHNIDFVPDDQSSGKYKAIVKIQGLSDTKPKSNHKRDKSAQLTSKFGQESRIPSILQDQIQKLIQQSKILGEYIKNQQNESNQQMIELNKKIKQLQTAVKLEQYISSLQIQQPNIQERALLSLFNIVLYYHFLGKDSEFLQDYHESMQQISDKSSIKIETLQNILNVYEQIFTLSQENVTQMIFGKYLNDVSMKLQTRQNQNIFRVCNLLNNERLRKKFDQLSKPLSPSKNKITIRGEKSPSKNQFTPAKAQRMQTPQKSHGNKENHGTEQKFNLIESQQKKEQLNRTVSNNQTFKPSLSPAKHSSSKFQQQINKSHDNLKDDQQQSSSWFKQLQVSDKYLSPKKSQEKQLQIQHRYIPERLEFMSSDELVSYYGTLLKKSKDAFTKSQKKPIKKDILNYLQEL